MIGWQAHLTVQENSSSVSWWEHLPLWEPGRLDQRSSALALYTFGARYCAVGGLSGTVQEI